MCFRYSNFPKYEMCRSTWSSSKGICSLHTQNSHIKTMMVQDEICKLHLNKINMMNNHTNKFPTLFNACQRFSEKISNIVIRGNISH